MAAALAIPEQLASGTPFPQRNLVLFITFIVILLTLVVQGLTLPAFIRRIKIFDGRYEVPEHEAFAKLRAGLMEHSFEFLNQKLNNQDKEFKGLEKLVDHWNEKRKTGSDSWLTGDNKALYVELLESQRQYLDKLNRSSDMPEELLRRQLYQIDLEEERLRRI